MSKTTYPTYDIKGMLMDFKHSGSTHSKIKTNREKLSFIVNLRQKQDLVKITIEKSQKVKKSEPTFPPRSLNKNHIQHSKCSHLRTPSCQRQ